jgi:TatD DNase family protein
VTPVPAAGEADVGQPVASLVDTHCHLQLLEERGALTEALEAAADAGVEQIVCVGLDVDDSDRCREIAERNAGVFFTVGWHPHQTTVPDPAQVTALDTLLRHPRAVAVGEVGLDQYWRPGYHETPIEIQRRGLAIMLELAAAHGKPVVIHDRESHGEILDALAGDDGLTGVMHCYSGDAEHARRCRARGFLVSFSGIVTFPRSQPIQAAAEEVDAAGYVVETDAPFLAPVPHRGQSNQPAFVAATAAAVARLRGVHENRVRRETTDNARRLFGLAAGDRLGSG